MLESITLEVNQKFTKVESTIETLMSGKVMLLNSLSSSISAHALIL